MQNVEDGLKCEIDIICTRIFDAQRDLREDAYNSKLLTGEYTVDSCEQYENTPSGFNKPIKMYHCYKLGKCYSSKAHF